METATTPTLTAKGERTREHILTTALQLFSSEGYEATTMRDIAAAAGCALGLTYRYFARKEELVLALYQRILLEMEAQALNLPSVSLAERFELMMHAKLASLAPYREPFGALMGAALNPTADVAVLGPHTTEIRRRGKAIFQAVVTGAKDAPREQQSRDLATLLYATHLGLILFWLYDRTPNQRATEELLLLSLDALRLGRRLLRVPPIASAMARLAYAIDAVFAGGS